MPRGDIVYVSFPQPANPDGHEQQGARPAVIVQNDTKDLSLSTTMVVPLTGNLKACAYPYHFLVNPSPFNGLRKQSVMLVSQLRAIDNSRIRAKIGVFEPQYMGALELKIAELRGL